MSTGTAWALLISSFTIFIVPFLALAGVMEWLWRGAYQAGRWVVATWWRPVILGMVLVGAAVWVAVQTFGTSTSASTITVTTGTGIHWAAGVTAIASVVAVVGVGGAIGSAVWAGEQVKESARSRQAGAVIDIIGRWDSQPMLEARHAAETSPNLRDKFFKAWNEGSLDYYTLQRVPNFFEDLALRENLGYVDLKIIRRTPGSSALVTWELWRPIMNELRAEQITVVGELRRSCQETPSRNGRPGTAFARERDYSTGPASRTNELVGPRLLWGRGLRFAGSGWPLTTHRVVYGVFTHH